jgi:hypothetical protein
MAITVGEEFDDISEIYDSTRHAATDVELRAISVSLEIAAQYLMWALERAGSRTSFRSWI